MPPRLRSFSGPASRRARAAWYPRTPLLRLPLLLRTVRGSGVDFRSGSLRWRLQAVSQLLRRRALRRGAAAALRRWAAALLQVRGSGSGAVCMRQFTVLGRVPGGAPSFDLYGRGIGEDDVQQDWADALGPGPPAAAGDGHHHRDHDSACPATGCNGNFRPGDKYCGRCGRGRSHGVGARPTVYLHGERNNNNKIK